MGVPEQKKFRDLFEGNTDRYGTEEGGSVVASADWHTTSTGHLTGAIAPVGVYPMGKWNMENQVGWGCVDFDEGETESLTHARNVQHVLELFGIKGWIERSRSKGYHVWVFKDGTISATIMRRALLAACQIADAPTKEINPKQDFLPTGKLGNYVRLPYPGALGSVPWPNPERRCMIEDGVVLWLHEFVADAWKRRESETTQLAWLAGLWKQPQRPARLVLPLQSEREDDAVDRLSPLARVVWRDGPRPDEDRSTRLWKLCCLIQEGGGHTIDECIELMLDADRRWGKFTHRGNPEYITSMVEKVWLE